MKNVDQFLEKAIKSRSGWLSFLISTVLIMGVAPVRAEDESSESWNFSFIPYGWLSRIEGQITANGQTQPINISVSDILNNLDGALIGQFETTKGNWSLYLNGTVAQLSDDPSVFNRPQSAVSVALDSTLLELGTRYRIHQWERGALFALGGARYTDLAVDLEIVNRSQSSNLSWVDPFVGLRSDIDLSEEIALSLRGDIGGFGVGSDFTWLGQGLVVYRLSSSTRFFSGFRLLGQDYTEGEGDSFIRYDSTLKGPILGLEIEF